MHNIKKTAIKFAVIFFLLLGGIKLIALVPDLDTRRVLTRAFVITVVALVFITRRQKKNSAHSQASEK